jgi:tetratricopeptide (TPR) repeat protein
LRAFPDRPEYLRAEAELLSELGRPARAAASWEAFMRSAPLPIEACPGLGKAYEAAGEIDRSLEAHRRCLALDPTQSDLRLFLAISLEHRERFEEAERLYRETLADSPSYQDARTGLARVLLRRDRLDEARQEISAVLAARPADADALFAAGLIAEKRGDLAQAKVFLKQAIAANPSYDEPIQALSRLERLP